MVTELMRRLEEASIDAFSVIERDVVELHAGGTLSVSIWVKDAGQVLRAARYCEKFGRSEQCSGVQAAATTCAGTAARQPAPNVAKTPRRRRRIVHVPGVMKLCPTTLRSVGIAGPICECPTNGMPDKT